MGLGLWVVLGETMPLAGTKVFIVKLLGSAHGVHTLSHWERQSCPYRMTVRVGVRNRSLISVRATGRETFGSTF